MSGEGRAIAVSVRAELDAPAGAVWDLIGDFNALAEWHPRCAKSVIEIRGGATVRVLETAEGATFVEKLEDADESGRTHTYSIVEGPLAVVGYLSRLGVSEREGGAAARVEWSCEFTLAGAPEAEVKAAVEDWYRTGIENLEGILARRIQPRTSI